MHAFQYQKPTSLADAVQLLKGDEDAKLLGGGMSLIPTMKLDLAMPSALVSLSGITDLRGITVSGDAVVIGAATTHAEVERSSDVQKAIPGLAALAKGIGDPQVRNRGTLGGAIAHADPAADYPAAVVALNATIETDRRKIAADDFFQGLFETALEADEIIKAVHFPIPEKSAYGKFGNPASKYAIVGVYVAKHKDGSVRVAVTGAGEKAFRMEAMEKALASDWSSAALDGITVPTDGLTSEPDASAAYRAHLIGVMAKRAVTAAA